VHVGTAQVHRPTLDDVFLTLTGRSLREAQIGDDQSGDDPQDPHSRKDAA
jgi:ABC-2 type transport system ATP-binding protein